MIWNIFIKFNTLFILTLLITCHKTFGIDEIRFLTNYTQDINVPRLEEQNKFKILNQSFSQAIQFAQTNNIQAIDECCSIINQITQDPHLIFMWEKERENLNKINLKKWEEYPQTYNPGFLELCLFTQFWPYGTDHPIMEEIKIRSKDDKVAQFLLGKMYYNGVGVEIDKNKSIELFKISAQNDFFRSLNFLGYIHGYSDIENINYDDAFNYYRKAAKLGYCVAIYNLGNMYERGMGVEKNLSIAHDLYLLSAKQKYANALCALGMLYHSCEGFEKDIQKAKMLYTLAANQNHTEAMANLSILYAQSIEQDPTDTQSFSLFFKYMLKSVKNFSKYSTSNIKKYFSLKIEPDEDDYNANLNPGTVDLNEEIGQLLSLNDELAGKFDLELLINNPNSHIKKLFPITYKEIEFYLLNYKNIVKFQNEIKSFFKVIYEKKITSLINFRPDLTEKIIDHDNLYVTTFSLNGETFWFSYGNSRVKFLKNFNFLYNQAITSAKALKKTFKQTYNHYGNILKNGNQNTTLRNLTQDLQAMIKQDCTRFCKEKDFENPHFMYSKLLNRKYEILTDIITFQDLCNQLESLLDNYKATINEEFYQNHPGLYKAALIQNELLEETAEEF